MVDRTVASEGFSVEEDFARRADEADPLRGCRDEFCLPVGEGGAPLIYFCGNSLGLQPKGARRIVEQELDDWARLGVEAHFDGATPWYSYHQVFREMGARLVGARPGEVVMMNSLTVNLHLLMVSFYQPDRSRYKILVETPRFPSDTYAVQTQLQHHGVDPAEGMLEIHPREGEYCIRTEDIERVLAQQGESIAVVMIGGVNFFTGQVFDMPRIAAAAHEQGCLVGFDLAHAAGNIPLSLHDWKVDFAVWCSYKYLNSGPGAVAGAYIHEQHAQNVGIPRFGGWWGNDPDTRFRMHLEEHFRPVPSVDGWQISNPPILSMAPLQASLGLFDDAGMAALRAKSRRLTGYLQFLLDQIPNDRYEVITPREEEARGCQLSILVHDDPEGLFAALGKAGVIGDFRKPNVIRVAPVPLYNTFHEVWRFAQILRQA
jgi:kynureninase